MRRFIRHPVSIPIDISIPEIDVASGSIHATDIGTGGLAFRCKQNVEPGTVIHIKITHVDPEFETEARVIWCRPHKSSTELGVEFLSNDDAFNVRMVEQVCHIENYRHLVSEKEGRSLTVQEAALEWVTKYAARFPNPGSESIH